MTAGHLGAYAGIGAVGGFLVGLMGVSTGLVLVPALVFFLGWSQRLSQGTALAVSLPPVGILAVMDYYHRGHVQVEAAAVMAGGIFLGGHYGGKLAGVIAPKQLRRLFGIMLFLIGVKMLLNI